MGKSADAPDPYATAQAQTQSNQQTANYNAALNRVNQYTPYGSSVYTQTGADASGAPQYRQDITLTPLAQQQLNDQLQQNADLAKLGYGLYGQASQSLSKPVNDNGLPALSGGPSSGGVQTSVGQTGQVQSSVGSGPGLFTGIQGAGGVQRGIGNTGSISGGYGSGGNITDGYSSGGDIQRGIAGGGPLATSASGGQIQNGLNYGSLSALPDPNSFNDAGKAASDAAYKGATARLDPQYTNYQNDLDAKLANQGVVQGSEAWQRAQDELGRQRTDAYGQAQNAAYQQGLAAQQQGYNQALSTRQQGANEITTAGNFANSAQAQGFGQNVTNANLQNSAQAQQFAQNQAQGQFANQAQAQANTQNANAAQFANTAQQQRNTQNQQQATFGNTAQQQAYDQAIGRANQANAAQAQQFSQNQAQATFSNDAQQQMYQNALQAGAFANAAQAQQFAQALQSGQFTNAAQAQAYLQALQSAQQNNSARAQGLQEQTALASLPLNQLNALRSGTQIQNPTFAQVPQSQAASTDVSGNVYKAYQLNSANQNNFLNGLFSLGSAAIMA